MQPFNAALVDPSVTAAELELATVDPAAAFPLVDAQDLLDDGDVAARSLLASVLRTPAQATHNLLTMREQHIPIGGVGLCLYDERHFAWNVAALWPTANEAGEHGAKIHRFKSFTEVPRHMSVVYINAHQGHIVHSLGGGLNNTSDYHEPGFNGVATMANTAAWCGATDWFGIETVNGVDTWPGPKKPKPRQLTHAEKVDVLTVRLHALQKAHHPKRAARLKLWIDELEAKK